MTDKFAYLAVDELAQGENVRFALAEIEDLAADIRRRGVLQAIVVIPNEDGSGAEVLVGRRRLAAAKLAGLDKIPCQLRPREAKANRVLDQAAENLLRVDLTPIEEATFVQSLVDEGLETQQIATQLHKSFSWVEARLRLLKMPKCLQDAVHNGEVGISKAVDAAPQLGNPDAVALLEECLKVGGGGLPAFWRDLYRKREEKAQPVRPPLPPLVQRPDDLLYGSVRMERHLWEKLATYVRELDPPTTASEWIADIVRTIMEDIEWEQQSEAHVPP